MSYLEKIFKPPIERLEALADRLQRTGELNEQSLIELNRIVHFMRDTPFGVDARVASNLAQAAETLAVLQLETTAKRLLEAADALAHLPRRRE